MNEYTFFSHPLFLNIQVLRVHRYARLFPNFFRCTKIFRRTWHADVIFDRNFDLILSCLQILMK